MGWAYFRERGTPIENTPISLFEQPLKVITHGRIFESLGITESVDTQLQYKKL